MCSLSAAILRTVKGLPTVALAACAYDATMGIGMLSNGPIKSPKDLEGRQMASTVIREGIPSCRSGALYEVDCQPADVQSGTGSGKSGSPRSGNAGAWPLLAASELRPLSRRSDLRGALQLGAHLGCMSGTAVMVWLARPYWWLLVPAMAPHGVTIVTLFAPMHECVHHTAFASRTVNDLVGWVAGVLSFYNSTFYRHFHAWHHRYTQDPARDPELMNKADSRW